jgi:hypothetical protein
LLSWIVSSCWRFFFSVGFAFCFRFFLVFSTSFGCFLGDFSLVEGDFFDNFVEERFKTKNKSKSSWISN